MSRVKKIITANEIIETVEEVPAKEIKVEVKNKSLGNPSECGKCTATYGKNWCLSCFIWKQKNKQ